MTQKSSESKGDLKKLETLDSSKQKETISKTIVAKTTIKSTSIFDLKDLNEKASYINFLVRDTIIHHIKCYVDPAMKWKYLKHMYESNSTSNRYIVKEKKISLKIAKRTSIEENLVALIDQFVGIGVVISDVELVDQTLTSLSKN